MGGLAPIEVEILLWRVSTQKIETNSGISLLKITAQICVKKLCVSATLRENC